MIKSSNKPQNQTLMSLQNESTPPPSLPKPNPKNASNIAKIQDLEQQIARYVLGALLTPGSRHY